MAGPWYRVVDRFRRLAIVYGDYWSAAGFTEVECRIGERYQLGRLYDWRPDESEVRVKAQEIFQHVFTIAKCRTCGRLILCCILDPIGMINAVRRFQDRGWLLPVYVFAILHLDTSDIFSRRLWRDTSVVWRRERTSGMLNGGIVWVYLAAVDLLLVGDEWLPNIEAHAALGEIVADMVNCPGDEKIFFRLCHDWNDMKGPVGKIEELLIWDIYDNNVHSDDPVIQVLQGISSRFHEFIDELWKRWIEHWVEYVSDFSGEHRGISLLSPTTWTRPVCTLLKTGSILYNWRKNSA